MLKMGWIISPSTVKQAAFDLQQKETESKTVAIVTSKYASCGAFLSVQRACQIPIVLHHCLQRYSLLCVVTSILSHIMTSSVPNLHNTKILNISGTRWDMTKRITLFFFTFKGLSNSPIFQYINFSFHSHFNDIKFPFLVYLLQRFCIISIHSVSVSQNKFVAHWGYLQSAETALHSVNRGPLLGACNSHSKPMQRHFLQTSLFLDIFPAK